MILPGVNAKAGTASRKTAREKEKARWEGSWLSKERNMRWYTQTIMKISAMREKGNSGNHVF
jgi:hypothetical protein